MSAARPLVGWYLHDHGAGHRMRFSAIRPHLDAEVVVFSSLAPPALLPDSTTWISLDPDDRTERTADGTLLDPAEADPTAGGVLHWAPLGHSGHAARFGAIASALASRRFDAFVVDVSVEVSLLVRLFGVPTVLVTQPGERDDRPHQLAFAAASRILAPWPDELYVPRALAPFASKTHFVGGISRFDGRRSAPAEAAEGAGDVRGFGAGEVRDADVRGSGAAAAGTRGAVPAPGSVLVLGAGGGGAVTPHDVEAAAAATADTSNWHAVGMPATAHVTSSGWTDDPYELLTSAEVVVSFGGQNAVADLAAVGARAIVVAQPRPFDEQEATARILQSSGLAVGVPAWPATSDWPDLLARARASTPDWSRWNSSSAASRAAAVIATVAAGRSAGAVAGADAVADARSAGAVGAVGAVGAAVAGAPGAALPATGRSRPRPVAVVTLFSAARLVHALNQFALLADAEPGALLVGVWLDEGQPPAIAGITIIHVPPGPSGLRLAAGRNAGAAEACRLFSWEPAAATSTPAASAAATSTSATSTPDPAPLLIFLDADCLPGPELLQRYRNAATEHPASVLCGPVTYLPEHAAPRTPAEFADATAPHPARPSLPAGTSRPADASTDEFRLFWSLSFACAADTWQRSGEFDEAYEGYGAEDTDFSRRLQQHDIELRWVGGAHAYHQHHPTSSPPWQHLDDILRNGSLYNDRWGHWPMHGWLTAFEQAGAVEWMHGSWHRVADSDPA